MTQNPPIDFKTLGQEYLPGHLGIEITFMGDKQAHAELEVHKHHLAPNGYLHAGLLVSLADTVAGYGCIDNLPEGAKSFTTIELKSNFLATARSGRIRAMGSLVHGGRTTQVWDVEITSLETSKVMALFRCTQMLIYR